MSTNRLPFLLTAENKDILAHSNGFMILQQHLADQYSHYEFCRNHTRIKPGEVPDWLLVRDILYALLVPIVELYDKAAQIAHLASQFLTPLGTLGVSNATTTTGVTAFTSKAQTAFLTLQSFLGGPAARDWCYARGCPACAVQRTISSTAHVRLVHAACLLSDVHYPFTIDAPTLPSFMFFLEPVLRAAAARRTYAPSVAAASDVVALRDGVEELIGQCLALDARLSRPVSPVSHLDRGETRRFAGEIAGPDVRPVAAVEKAAVAVAVHEVMSR